MDVIGNNIANVNTTGFKAGVVTFKDVYYQNKINPSSGTATLGGVNPAQVGYGVRLNSTVANMTQSGFNYTDSKWDMAIDGEGFFQVMDGSGKIYYTRAGAFSVDADGYLVNASGFHVLGVTGDSEGVQPSSEVIRIIIPDTEAHCSSATKMVNGTNVTLSMSAPSDNTDMTVTFTPANYPYASYANGILNIFFDKNAQYTSEDDFEQAIATAIKAGGITLPDDVELQFAFESIPDDYQPVAASNIVDDYKVETKKASYQFHSSYLDASTNTTKHAYMTFSVNDPTCRDQIKVNVSARPAGGAATEKVTYKDGVWTLDVYDDSTASEINAAIKAEIERQESAGVSVATLNCDNLVLPSGAQRATVFKDMVGTTAADVFTPTTVALEGGTKTGVTLDFEVQEAGAFANEYSITFSYSAGYGKTKAVWDENNLTITISNDSTIADVNEAIKKAAGGDKYKLLTFNEISGLNYGEGYEFDRKVDPEVGKDTYTVVETDKFGNTRKKEGVKEDELGKIDWTTGTVTYKKADNNDGTAADFKSVKDAGDIWQPVFRESFFGGNPSINPAGGKDSFFTETAKLLSTFALEDGRLGGPQPLDSCEIVIQTDGTIVGIHPVHGYITLGRVDLVLFENPNGLSQAGGTNFAETVASGAPKLAIAGGDEGAGSILSNTLEMSNVDLSQEFTDMITTQRGFQANSRVITVSDTMLEELLSLKR